MKSSRPQSREVTGRFREGLRLCSSSHDSVASWAQRVREAQLHACIDMVPFVLTSASAPLFYDLAQTPNMSWRSLDRNTSRRFQTLLEPPPKLLFEYMIYQDFHHFSQLLFSCFCQDHGHICLQAHLFHPKNQNIHDTSFFQNIPFISTHHYYCPTVEQLFSGKMVPF